MDFPNGISNFSKVKFINGFSKRVKRGSVAFPSVCPFFSFLKRVLSTSEGGKSFVKSWRYPCKYVKIKKFEGKIL